MRVLGFIVLVISAAPIADAGSADAPALPRFVNFTSQPLDCNASPFGDQLFIGRESEFAELAVTAGVSELHMLQWPHDPAPPQGAQLEPWISTTDGVFTGATYGMLGIDLNGDGQDELVTASKNPGGGIRLDVLEHDKPAEDHVKWLDHWIWSGSSNPQEVRLVKGNLDGSGDGRQELAVVALYPDTLRVFVLTGNVDGGIAQENGEFAGSWSAGWSDDALDVSTGDLLLDGRDQILIGSFFYPGGEPSIRYRMLEFDSPNPVFAPVAGNTRVGSAFFNQSLAQITYDDGGADAPDTLGALNVRIGDVVDSAQAELVSLIEYVQGGEGNARIAMRLQHFITTRDNEGRVTWIGLATRPNGQAFDSTILANDTTSSAVSFQATLANVDMALGREIVVVQATGTQEIQLAAYKADVDLTAAFSWDAHSTFVRFEDTSTGPVDSYQWDFGDGTAPVSVANPSHEYAQPGTYPVSLTITDERDRISSYNTEVTVQAAADSHTSEVKLVPYFYKLREHPDYLGSHPTGNNARMLNVATGDLDQDGAMEVLTLASTDGTNLLRSVWTLHDDDGPGGELEPYFKGTHQTDSRDGYGPLQTLQLVVPDFDGDSLQVKVGTDCRSVEEPQIRQVIWLPPYFRHLQAEADKEAVFGRSVTGGSSIEKQAGSYTSHDISGYIGATVSTPGGSVSATVKATAGRSYQQSHGAIHSTSQEHEVNEGYSQNAGDALVILEENAFNCYSYDVSMAFIGQIPDSGVRMCQKIDGSRHMVGTDALAWDTSIPAAGPGRPPAQWVPLHRDWESMALFRPVTSDADFQPGQGADKVTDGQFDTAAMSVGDVDHPYLTVDLGQVRDISNIRIFPAAGHAADLANYRIVTSASPLPDRWREADVHVFQPMTSDHSVYDRWVAWTRDPTDPSRMTRARYIRLEHDGSAPIRVAELQAFGPVHADPPRYPDAVCDADLHDGKFLARVWDPVHAAFRNIQVHGDLLWDATWNNTRSPWPDTGTCTNDGNLRSSSIWTNVTVGGSASVNWSLSNSQTNLTGETTSFDSAIHVGAEFDLQAGFVASVNAGGSVEFATGLTSETQTSSYWTRGLDLGGAISGFANQYAGLVNDCAYNPRPYAYHLTEKSITGYQHDIYVVDYIVHQSPATWQRGQVPILCTHDDPVFTDGFEE